MYKYKSLQEVQLKQEHLSFLQNFIITKCLKKKVNDNLSVCVDEHSLCDLSITGDLSMIYQIKFTNVKWSKGNDVTIPNGEVPYQLLS